MLYDLPYYEPIRMVIIDPMHNLFLGTAKHFMTNLTRKETIKVKDNVKMQECMDKFQVPPEMSRIPRKIASSWCELTAAEWMHWTLYFSRIVFRQIGLEQLKESSELIWNYFVEACRLMCGRYIRRRDVDTIHTYLHTFCQGVQDIFGANGITMNMHLNCHLKDVIIDYGPICAYWTINQRMGRMWSRRS